MAKYTCTCGARYKFPDSATGKQARCKKCGAVFTLPEEADDGVIAIAEEDTAVDEAATAAAAVPRQGELFIPPSGPGAVAGGSLDAGSIGVVPPPTRGFATDVLWTFLFPTTPGNLLTWLAIWLTLGVAQFACCFWPLQLLVYGWYCAFLFAVLESAAAGDSDLPNHALSRDIVGDMLAPFVKWIGSWALVLLPAMIYLLYQWRSGGITGFDVIETLVGGLPMLLQSSTGTIGMFELLVAVGVFLWPMVILCVALGGFESLYRMDLILLTIVRTIGVYAVTIALIFVAVLIEEQLTAIAAASLMGGAVTVGSMVSAAAVIGTLTLGLAIYFDIVLMRLIGLYYHHFKRKFAWDWG